MEHALWTVYIDGSAKPNPGKMGIGGVIHGPDGRHSTFSHALTHTGCNNEAEAHAALHALQWLHAQGAQHVLLYTDNSILAQQLGPAPARPIVRLAALYDTVRAQLRAFASAQVQWLPRHKNEVADALSRVHTI